MQAIQYQVEFYEDRRGRQPFRAWLQRQDTRIQQRIEQRIARVARGNLGDYASVGSGVFELRDQRGYRIYFARVGRTVILLLYGGDKNSQPSDIARAQRLWQEYQKERIP